MDPDSGNPDQHLEEKDDMVDTRRPDSAVERIRERVAEKAARRAAAREADDRVRGHGPHPDAARPRRSAPAPDRLPGVDAEKPTQIPAQGWLQIVKRGWAENKADNMPIISGGVAFFAFLAIFPALIALVSLYGLIASPETVTDQIDTLSESLPEEAAAIIGDQLRALATADSSALSIGLVVSILAAVWSASGGVGNLITAVNLAYDEVETRNFVKLKALSLALTLGAILFVIVTFSLVALTPIVLDALPLGILGTILAQVLRWVVLLGVMAVALSVLYRLAPDRDAPKFRWVSLGSVAVTVVWVLVSLGFSFYVSNFGSYDATYGAIAGVIVLMLWLYLTCYLVLLGAEINAEAEHQTAHDTTVGPEVRMGERGALVADELPDSPTPTEEQKTSA